MDTAEIPKDSKEADPKRKETIEQVPMVDMVSNATSANYLGMGLTIQK